MPGQAETLRNNLGVFQKGFASRQIRAECKRLVSGHDFSRAEKDQKEFGL
jgi:hypothetical protein